MEDGCLFKLDPDSSEFLYIIGNGFDISHGIKSSYSDFKQYLKDQNNNRLIDLMDTFFSSKRELWSDIETALGDYDEDVIYGYCNDDKKIDYDHMMRSVYEMEDSPDYFFKPVIDEFLDVFCDWVNSIDITEAIANPDKNFSPKSRYFTFNYTDTLEHIYKIPTQQVNHIHGSRLIPDDTFVIGHNNLKSDTLHDDYEEELYFEQDTKNKIIRWMNDLYKDTSLIINRNKPYFTSLSNIKLIVVIGHSLYDVDWPYFDEINKSASLIVQWIFYFHTIDDVKRINKYISHAGILTYRLLAN